MGRDNFRTITVNEDTEIIPEFMSAYYSEKSLIPPGIYVMQEEGVMADTSPL